MSKPYVEKSWRMCALLTEVYKYLLIYVRSLQVELKALWYSYVSEITSTLNTNKKNFENNNKPQNIGNMEQPASSSNSSSFEDLAKDSDIKEGEKDDGFMDILGNNQLTKKVGQ